MREIDRIVLHCSDSKWGDVMDINWWHAARNFICEITKGFIINVGYHFIITNSNIDADVSIQACDGAVTEGRPLGKVGAHCAGYNATSIGICLIGVDLFTPKQLDSAVKLVQELRRKFNIPLARVQGHYELDPVNRPNCPGFDMEVFRRAVGNI